MGLGASYAIANGQDNLLSYGPSVSLRAARAFAVTGGMSFTRVPRFDDNVTATTIGVAARVYANGGSRRELFLDVGPAVTLFDGDQSIGFAMAPGLSFTGDEHVRVLLGVGGFAYAQSLRSGRFGRSTSDSEARFVFAPTLGIDFLIGEQALR